MRKIAANWIITVKSAPLKNSYVVLDDDQRIVEIVDTGGKLTEIAGLEFFSGLLLPGIILGEPIKDHIRLNQSPLSIKYAKHQKVLFARGVEAVSALHDLEYDLSGFSVMDLMTHLQQQFPGTPFNELIKKMTVDQIINPVVSDLGSIAINKKPGILLMTGFNYAEFKITNLTKVTRLV